MRKQVKKLLHNDEKCVTIKALYVNLLLGGIRIMATFYASKTGEVSAREKEHSALVRELAGECMTLLENDGTLPLAGAGKVAVYGNGVRHTVKGGTGSGDVNTRTVVTIEQGLKEAGFEILTGKWLDEYDKVLADAQAAYQAELAKKAEELHVPIFAVMFSEVFAQPDVPVITEKEDTDTAIYVLSRNSGEGADRYNRACDYLLGENELADIAYLAEHYEKTVLILNIANLVDTTELKKIKGLNAILLAGQAGNATGNIVADVVLGKSIPSGKLTDTWAASYEDYPSSKNFSHNNGDTNDEYYSDGIYVGYRYFDTFNVTPNYCFGYGKGYTDFETEVRDVEADAKNVTGTAILGMHSPEKKSYRFTIPHRMARLRNRIRSLAASENPICSRRVSPRRLPFPSRRDLWLPTMRKKQHGYSRQERITSVSATAPEQRKWQQP